MGNTQIGFLKMGTGNSALTGTGEAPKQWLKKYQLNPSTYGLIYGVVVAHRL